MLEGISAAEPSFETWLLYGVRDDRDYIMRSRLETIARTHSNVHLRMFYSRPARAVNGPNIEVGHIDLEAMKRLLPSNACDFYVCSPAAMMESMTRDLQVWGVPIERVHTEAFGPSAIKQVGQGPTSQADSPFDVTFERSGTTVQWSQGGRRCSSWPRRIRWPSTLAAGQGAAAPARPDCFPVRCATCISLTPPWSQGPDIAMHRRAGRAAHARRLS